MFLALVVGAAAPGGVPSFQAIAQEGPRAVEPNDQLYEQYQWNLQQIRAPEAWDLTTGSVSVTVAILDTGVSLAHPDLIRKLVPGYDFVNDRAVPDDDHGNGTHVAGIIAAETNNRMGIAGVAWQARIMPVKVLDATAQGDPARAARGVIWAVDRGASIVNLGLAGPTASPELEEAIAYAYVRRVLVVAPVANHGTSEPSYPAASPYVLAVGATDRSDRRLSTSNTGVYLSVSAPGDQIASTFRAPGGTDSYAVASTTAQAAAHVTGVAALLLALNPMLGPDELRAVIESSADDVGPPGPDPETGYGRVNAARAVQFAAPWNHFPRGSASYLAQASPATTLYFPLVLKDANGWNTSLTVQNTSQRSASLNLTYVDSSGRPLYAHPATLAAMGSSTFHPARLPGLAPGFVGAAVARASVPIAGVANQDRTDRDRLSYEGESVGAPMVWAPLVTRGASGWDTGLQIQNLGTSPTTVQVTLYPRGDAGRPVEKLLALPALTSQTVYLPAEDALPAEWIGSATAQSLDGQPLGMVVNQLHVDGAGAAYLGVSRPSVSAYAPLVQKSEPRSTGLQIQNAGIDDTAVAISYLLSDESSGPRQGQLALRGSGSAAVDQAAVLDLPESFSGAAALWSVASQMAVAVIDANHPPGRAAAYPAPSSGDLTAFAPLIHRGFAGWESDVHVQNIGAAPTGVVLAFYSEEGAFVGSAEDTIAPDGARTYHVQAMDNLPRGFIGSAVIASVGGAPIVAVVSHTK